MQPPERPKVGVGVIIMRDGQILLGKRKNAHGDGSWCPPGGHLEFGETPEMCAIRETKEEAGLIAVNPRRGPYTNDFFEKEAKHYITLYMIADAPEGEPIPCEPEKCERWEWFPWDRLPQPLFLPFQHLIDGGFRPV